MSFKRRGFFAAVAFCVLSTLQALPASAGDATADKVGPCETTCVNVPCGAECWTIRIQYRRDGVVQVLGEDTFWGSISGATCRADEVADHGFWIAEWEHPTKIPASMIELVVIDRAVAAEAQPAAR